jgi:hypothetical protein
MTKQRLDVPCTISCLLLASVFVGACSSKSLAIRLGPDASVPDGFVSDGSGPDGSAVPGALSEVWTLNYVVLPTPELDVVFVIDNAPTMAYKHEKMVRELSSIVAGAKNLTDDSYPSLRIAILDGDLGTGGAVTSGSCGARNGSSYGDFAALQLPNAAACGVTDPNARWLQSATQTPANFTGDIAQVLGCLVNGLGQNGCVYQQPLDVLSLASDPTTGSLVQFLRPEAYLAVVIISDQDDCSAFPNVAAFAPDLQTEMAGLRCATRGHACGGSLSYPTAAPFSARLQDCVARTDPCASSTDVSQATDCTPLADVHVLAEKIKALKPGAADDRILVTGILGRPSPSQSETATYEIAPIPNPNHEAGTPTPATVYDLWPVCYEANHPPTHPDPVTGFDAVAADFGAKPGLRLSAFVDEFGLNGRKKSICDTNWSPALGFRITDDVFRNDCPDRKLLDTDPTTPVVDPTCRVVYTEPSPDGIIREVSLSQCDATATVKPCWRLVNNKERCPALGQYIQILSEHPSYVAPGTKSQIQCAVCPDTANDAPIRSGCAYTP